MSFTIDTTGILLLNYDAWNVSPYLLTTSSSMSSFATNIPDQASVVYNLPDGTEIDPVTVAVYNTGLTIAEIKAASTVGSAVETRNLYHKARLVAGGFRLFKTSRSENESGTIRGMYAQRGVYANKSIKTLVDDTNGRFHTKVYVAGSSGCCYGRTGYLLGGTYRPRD